MYLLIILTKLDLMNYSTYVCEKQKIFNIQPACSLEYLCEITLIFHICICKMKAIMQ